MKSKLLLVYSWLIRTIFFFLPDIPIFMRFRGWCYGIGMRSCGKDFQVTHDAIIKDLQNISIGKHVFIGNMSFIMGSGTIQIEDEVMIAPHVVVISGNHTSQNGSFRYGKGDIGNILIKRGSWVAANCTIAKDSSLPENSVLAANSFLNVNFEIPNSIYAGVPATFKKRMNLND